MTNPTKKFQTLMIAAAILSLGFSDSDSRWNRISAGIREADIQRIFINKADPGEMWITTAQSIYQVTNIHDRYQFPPLTPQVHPKTNEILSSTDALYLATEEGLYQRAVGGYHFDRIFSSSDPLERRCTAIVEIDGKLFLGTRKGLFIKGKTDSTWQRLNGEIAGASISEVVAYGGAIYALNSDTIYRIDPLKNSYTKIFTLGAYAKSEVEEPASQVVEEETNSTLNLGLNDFKYADGQKFYLATQKGVYATNNAGQTWERMPTAGLPYADVRRLHVTETSDGKDHGLLAATSKGVYRYASDRWQQMYQGLESNDVSDLAEDNQGNIYAATTRGLFVLPPKALTTQVARPEATGPIAFKDYQDIENYFKFEPAIRDVQTMAIEYAEVHPDKIKQWRKQAQRRALAPNFSTGANRSATEMFHWDSGANPDALLKGRDFLDWDVNLSWNLGDLIWNNDQTSIDSRSKLMVELREDVLDQVTRIYFERRRIQVDLLGSVVDLNQKIEQQMRLAELTAILDGFTGGKFSREIEHNKLNV
jgi:ligand-binding sensor domain-containing protein